MAKSNLQQIGKKAVLNQRVGSADAQQAGQEIEVLDFRGSSIYRVRFVDGSTLTIGSSSFTRI